MRSLNLIFAGSLCLVVGSAALTVTRAAPLERPSRSPAMVDLGRELFLDSSLSQDGSVSCSSCHEPARAFSDGHSVSIGVYQRRGTRNTPSLLNAFEGEPLFWDGRRNHLDVAVLDPLVNFVEMGNASLTTVVQRLQTDQGYRKAFAKAFHQGNQSVSATNMGNALAAYIASLSRPPSAYDRFEAGRPDALSHAAREGLRLFTGNAECAQCHDPTDGRFTDEKFHQSGVGLDNAEAHLGKLTETAMRQNLQVAALGSAIGSNAELAALGRFLISHRATDVGAFRTPSLRNVALTAPYMHDGSVATLDAAVDTEIYYRGLATGRPLALTSEERSDLMAFLRSLTRAPESGRRPATGPQAATQRDQASSTRKSQ